MLLAVVPTRDWPGANLPAACPASFIGLPARALRRVASARAVTEVVTDGQVVEAAWQPAGLSLQAYQKRFKVALRPGLPRFCGGLAGYFGYDAVRHIERSWSTPARPTPWACPTSCCCRARSWPSSTTSGKLYLIVYADPGQTEAHARGKKRLRELKDQLKYSVSARWSNHGKPPAQRSFAKQDYLAAVERAKELIAAGDFMQVQVGQRIHKRFEASPLSLYRALRSLNPRPHVLLPPGR